MKIRGHLLVGLLDVGLIVREATSHDAAEDEVKGRGPGPILFEIVELEPAVRRNKRGLDGAEVDPDNLWQHSIVKNQHLLGKHGSTYLCLGVRISVVNGPVPIPCPHVKH